MGGIQPVVRALTLRADSTAERDRFELAVPLVWREVADPRQVSAEPEN